MARLTLTATQGSADAFVASEVATGLSGVSGRAYQLREAFVEFDQDLAGGADEIEFALSRRTKSAMARVTDVDVIFKLAKRMAVATSGGAIYDKVWYYQPVNRDIFIVEDPIYALLDSNSIGSAVTAYCELIYDVVSISDIDRLTLLTQSLTE